MGTFKILAVGEAISRDVLIASGTSSNNYKRVATAQVRHLAAGLVCQTQVWGSGLCLPIRFNCPRSLFLPGLKVIPTLLIK
jgi:hypothetical protein